MQEPSDLDRVGVAVQVGRFQIGGAPVPVADISASDLPADALSIEHSASADVRTVDNTWDGGASSQGAVPDYALDAATAKRGTIKPTTGVIGRDNIDEHRID